MDDFEIAYGCPQPKGHRLFRCSSQNQLVVTNKNAFYKKAHKTFFHLQMVVHDAGTQLTHI